MKLSVTTRLWVHCDVAGAAAAQSDSRQGQLAGSHVYSTTRLAFCQGEIAECGKGGTDFRDASFELGCAFYWNREWDAADAALAGFIDGQPGQTLREKNQSWKALVPGYSGLALTDPTGAGKLSGVELVPGALYWRAMTLSELRWFREARQLVADLKASFPDCGIKRRVERLAGMIADVLGEGR